MMTMRKLALTLCAGLTIGIMGPTQAWAIDFQPFDWVPLPVGTDVVMGYYEYGRRNEFNSTISGTVSNNTSLDSHIGIARYLHYSEAFGHRYDFNFLVPFGSLNNGQINGNSLGNASGVGDPIASAGMWFINQPEQKRYFSAAGYLTLPIGTYHKQQALNLGGNRWQTDLQADFTQGFADKFTIDISADWIWYGNNTAAGTGNQVLSQKATYGAYTWLSYDVSDAVRRAMPAASNASVSIGYAGTFGGVQKLDGVSTGTKTAENQVRLTYMMFFNPAWQGLLSVNHDVNVSGQFKQNFGLVLRVAKLF